MISRALTKLSSLGHFVVQTMLDRAAVISTRAVAAPDDERPLVIVRVDAIGDFVVWLGSAQALVAHYKPRRVVLIANQLVADLARATELFDEVISLNVKAFQRDWRYRYAMMRRIRSLGSVVAIQPTYSRSFWLGDGLIKASGAQERVGQVGDQNNIRYWQKRVSDQWYTRLVPNGEPARHEFERNAGFLKALGISSAAASWGRLGFVGERPGSLAGSRAYFVVVPGAGSDRRIWPLDRFAALSRKVSTQHDLRLVVCGSPNEKPLCEALAREADLDDTLVLAGQTSVPELIETIRGARLTVANDSSAVHIAAAVGAPSLCLLGGGHFARFLPYPEELQNLTAQNTPSCVHADMPCFNCNWQCSQPHKPKGPFPCIEAITIDQATKTASQLLETRKVFL
ncbi:MAG: glycosyltransferase family 9 protein [Pseudomonadota bacterium]